MTRFLAIAIIIIYVGFWIAVSVALIYLFLLIIKALKNTSALKK